MTCTGETTISYDYDVDEVVVYTTLHDVYEAMLGRSIRPMRHRSLLPGYELIYRLTDWPQPHQLLQQ